MTVLAWGWQITPGWLRWLVVGVFLPVALALLSMAVLWAWPATYSGEGNWLAGGECLSGTVHCGIESIVGWSATLLVFTCWLWLPIGLIGAAVSWVRHVQQVTQSLPDDPAATPVP